MSLLRLTLNGKPVEIDVPESRYLSEVLREDLGLTGTKIGCNEAECGICTVLVDGTPVSSCVYPAFKAQGTAVETIESLSAAGTLHPLQQAFLDHGAVQCGICTPGMIMTAKALIDEKGASLTDDDIAVALKDTYCRCTGYQSVACAIRQVASPLPKPISSQTGLSLPNSPGGSSLSPALNSIPQAGHSSRNARSWPGVRRPSRSTKLRTGRWCLRGCFSSFSMTVDHIT